MTIRDIADLLEDLAAIRGNDELFLGDDPVRIEVRKRIDGEAVVSFEAGGVVHLAVVTRKED